LRVHPSNYRVVGFTEEATIEELAELARERSLLCLDDIGSGALGPGRPRGIAPDEPTFASSLASGADLVLASGDKLLGGPQCGLALGQSAVVARLKADPLARAMRVDKLTLAALEATLRLAEDVEAAHRGIPLWAFLDSTCSELTVRGRSILRALAGTDWKVSLEYTTATVGGGSVPGQLLASVAVRLSPPFPSGMAEAGAVAHLLRLGEPSVVGRVSEGFVWLDLRAIPPECDELLVEAVRRCGVGARSFAPTGAALNDTVE
jgi:L-seryl-tRNA(Ser) seleniumtransferase